MRLFHPVINILSAIILSIATCLSAEGRDFVVVIDPGHGGKDAGALGVRTNEKSINLNVALKLRDLLQKEAEGVKVEMTRDDDRFITLQQRPEIANRKHADIFVSIHANSVPKTSPTHSTVNGAAVYTLGLDKSQANLNVAMRENEVIKLEADYSETYQGFDPSSTESYIVFEMMQHKNMEQSIELAEAVQNQLVRHAGRKNNGVKQAPFWVLVRTSMPAILVELDFICNPTQETFMASEKGSSQLARAIFNGIQQYRKITGNPVKPKKSTAAKQETPAIIAADEAAYPEEPAVIKSGKEGKNTDSGASKQSGEIVYKIQFLTSPRQLNKNDRRLSGLKNVGFYQDGGSYKYTCGEYKTQQQAAADIRQVKKRYPDAFVIKTCDGKRVR